MHVYIYIYTISYMMIMMMMMMTMMMMVLTSSDPFHGPPFEASKDGGSREHQPNGITFDHGNVYNVNLFFCVSCGAMSIPW